MSLSAPPFDTLSQTCDVAALAARRSTRWQPGLAGRAGPVLHSEVFAPANEASGAAVALALARDELRAVPQTGTRDVSDRRAALWVQTREAVQLTGRPYRAGLPEGLRHRIIHAEVATPEDALFALEEGVRCREMAFVVGEIAGNPRALDFTASRRLTLAAERHGVPLYLVRLDAQRDLSSARMRWDVAAAPSLPNRWNVQAPGSPAWQVELFRARAYPPGRWLLSEDGGKLAADRAKNGEAEAPVRNWSAGLRHRRRIRAAGR